MFNISNFFERFSQLKNNAFVVRDAVIQAIHTVTGIQLEGANVEVKEGVARIQIDPLRKNVIYIKKTAILDALKQQGVNLKDIK